MGKAKRGTMRGFLLALMALCVVAVGARGDAPHYGIDPGTTTKYSPPDELLESTADVEGGEVSLLEETKGNLGESDDDDEEEDDEGPGGIDDAPDWSLGKGEQPKGEKKMKGGWTMRVFTPEQEKRLGVNMYGEHKKPEDEGILGESKEKDDDDESTADKETAKEDADAVDDAVEGADDSSALPSDDP